MKRRVSYRGGSRRVAEACGRARKPRPNGVTAEIIRRFGRVLGEACWKIP
jgi:hypothetical protein